MRRSLLGVLLFVAVLVGAAGGALWLRGHRQAAGPRPAPAPPGNQTSEPASASQEVTVYFAREAKTGDYDYNLVPVKRTVSVAPSASAATASLEALAKGPTPAEESQGLLATLPAGTRVLGVSVEDGLATADFSPEIKQNFPGGSEWEETVVYSIVNTLTEQDGIRKVRIKVGGAPVESLGEHLGLAKPLTRNTDLLARGKEQ